MRAFFLTLLFTLGILISPSRGLDTNQTSTKDGLNLKTNIREVVPSVTSFLELKCELDPVGLDGKLSILSLVIYQWNPMENKYEELTSLSQFNSGKVNTIKDVGAEMSGYLNSNRTSVIRMSWTFPSSSVAGRYMCESNVVDYLGRPTRSEVTISLSVAAPVTDDMAEAVRTLKEDVRNLTDGYSSLYWNLNFTKESLNYLRQDYYNLRDKFNKMRSDVFHESYIYIDRQRLVWTTSPYYSFDTAQAICTLVGGKLAEVQMQKIFDKHTSLANQGYKYFSWLGPRIVNGTVVYSSGKASQLEVDTLPENDQCIILNPNATAAYYADCVSTTAYHALCTVS